MFKRKLAKVIVSLLRRIANVSRAGAKRLMRAMLRSLMAMGRRAKLPVAGFVLPTVTMVMLVVVLLTLAITLRSFDRAQNARNVRVNQAVLAAASPALDRAKAKIQFLLKEDPQRPTATPSDNEMYRIMSSYTSAKDLYTFGDETRLRLRYDLNTPSNGIQPFGAFTGTVTPGTVPAGDTILEDNEAINTAWRYAVDTDNNGKFDTYTLYGIFFRSPDRDPGTGKFTRARKPLESRTPPMPAKLSDPACAGATGTSASLVGDSGWYKSQGRLKKSFFVYTVNLPITQISDPAKEEIFKGTTSFSALEYQQDQSRIPLSNNAIVYEDDLEISPGFDLRLNGRIFTNSNLIVTRGNTGSLNLYQVSSQSSCFYDQENSKIVVGGNIVNGSSSATPVNPVGVHLFKKLPTPVDETLTITPTTQSVDGNTALEVLYNNKAYSDRLSLLVKQQLEADTTGATDPISVINRKTDLTRQQALQGYFKERLRKVPFAEVPAVGGNSYTPYTVPPAPATAPSVILGSGDTLRPVAEWNLPNNGTATAATTYPGLDGMNIKPDQIKATNPEKPEPFTEEAFLGDRLQVGNNLPAQRWDEDKAGFIGLEPAQTVGGATKWDAGEATDRTRTPRITQLSDVGATDRGGFWEISAAQPPKTAVDGIGGLRVITGGGVYERLNSFLLPPTWVDATGTPKTAATDTYDDPATGTIEHYPVVWPDTMPMSPVLGVQKVYNNGATDTATPNAPANNWATQSLPATSASLPSGAASIIDPNTPKYAKGDLRMRATAVYHYANNAYDPSALTPDQTPIACISSYYDPSTSSTAKNLSGLSPVSGDATPPNTPDTIIGSNNGIVYAPPATARPTAASSPEYPPTVATDLTTALGGLGLPTPTELEKQANYVFPNGRFANKPLRDALLKSPGDRTLADNAAIDATLCSLEILQKTAPDGSVIPDGAIKEVAFLDGREIKAIDRNDSSTTVDETFTLSSTLAQSAKLSGNYDLALEERQPLEIRATVLDIDVLRTTPIDQNISTGPKDNSGKEYLLPYSGIIYASRDDALPDRSDRSANSAGTGIDEDTSKTVSPTDSRLDPTRRPNGIMLINGTKLFRGGATPAAISTVEEVVKEKGITLVSNLPVYIKGDFNKHTQEEFQEALTATNFYSRSTLNPSFACRQGDPRLPSCTGDNWRPATVLGDAVTILSNSFREGFRNEGDFDLRNNVGTAAVVPRREQGFYNNNFVTNGLSSGAFDRNGELNGPDPQLLDSSYLTTSGNGLNSSYFNNFVTPVQRRGNYPEYLMEVCTRLPVSACGDDDWYVDPTAATPLKATNAIGQSYTIATHKAGTTAEPPDITLQRFPRRVAFQRIITGGTQNDLADTPSDTKVTALGINNPGNIAPFNSLGTSPDGPTPRVQANSLWFAIATSASPYPTPPEFGNNKPLYFINAVTLSSATDGFQFTDGLIQPTRITTSTTSTTPTPPNPKLEPLLMPVLQIHSPTAGIVFPPDAGISANQAQNTKWLLQVPTATGTQELNLIIGAGDVPSRQIDSTSTTGEFNGGVQNLPRFLEKWRDDASTVGSKIFGAFIQLNRSAYATAPYAPRFGGAFAPQSAFSPTITTATNWYPNLYVIGNNSNSTPFFMPPARTWGFDVGLLSQPPDLFTQRFTTPPTQTKPTEYFREVNRNDEWVETLLCAVSDDNNDMPMVTGNLRPTTCP